VCEPTNYLFIHEIRKAAREEEEREEGGRTKEALIHSLCS